MKSKVEQYSTACVSVCLCLLAVGCSWPFASTTNKGSGDGGTTVGGTGTLAVRITDKPYPFEFISEALVTITRVEVHRVDQDDAGSNGIEDDNDLDTNGLEEGDGTDTNGVANDHDDGDVDNGDCTTNGDCEDGPWITILEETKEFDLLQLQNGQTDLLASADIPAGTYNQLRLFVPEGQITLIEEDGDGDTSSNGLESISSNGTDDATTNGRVFALQIPSGEQTGIKLHFVFEVEAEKQTTLLLDVDLSRAFKPVPGGAISDPSDIKGFTFSPSLGTRLINVSDAGSISGTVTNVDTNGLASGLPDVGVTVFDDETEVTTTSTDEDGAYVLSGLWADTYRVEFSAEGFEDAEVTDVVVVAGEVTEDVDVVLTPTPQ